MTSEKTANQNFRIETSINNGIERISYYPEIPNQKPALLFQHGMWHGAWCWSQWQTIFAELGWESHAISLPGHGASEQQGSNQFKTMGQYLSVLSNEIDRFPQKPILIGHSMGGALTQWYLKKIADDLPAVIFLAAWTSHSTFADGTTLHLKRDPFAFFLSGISMSSTPFIRNAESVASMLISNDALYVCRRVKTEIGKRVRPGTVTTQPASLVTKEKYQYALSLGCRSK